MAADGWTLDTQTESGGLSSKTTQKGQSEEKEKE